jgi:hypothetical protein
MSGFGCDQAGPLRSARGGGKKKSVDIAPLLLPENFFAQRKMYVIVARFLQARNWSIERAMLLLDFVLLQDHNSPTCRVICEARREGRSENRIKEIFRRKKTGAGEFLQPQKAFSVRRHVVSSSCVRATTRE